MMQNKVSPVTTASKTNWSSITIAILIVGYAGYYLCRSDLSVARPLIVDQYSKIGITKAYIGGFTGLATALYAGGKFFFGSVADMVGGKRMFLLGMAGAVLATLLFGAGGVSVFVLAWCANRFIQSSGWVGMVKISSRWFSYSSYGAVMGLISLSFLFGDFLSRIFLGELIKHGWTWQQLFFVSAAVLTCIFVPSALLLRETPKERGLPEPEAGPESVFAEKQEPVKLSLPELLKPLLSSPRFWTVCALSFGFTFMRETFNDWTPTFLHEAGKLSEGDAASCSSLFPLFGGFSVIGAGFLSDRMKQGGRAALIAIGLGLATLGLLLLAFGHLEGQTTIYVGLTAVLAFVLIGPYSFLAGAISLDFGGKQASATACGWIDGIGYIGGILSGALIGKLSESSGWQTSFIALAITAFISCVIAIAYWASERTRVIPIRADQPA